MLLDSDWLGICIDPVLNCKHRYDKYCLLRDVCIVSSTGNGLCSSRPALDLWRSAEKGPLQMSHIDTLLASEPYTFRFVTDEISMTFHQCRVVAATQFLALDP